MKNILKEIKGVFVAPKKQYYLGTIQYGTPYFSPRDFNPSIITIRKTENKGKYNRCFNFDRWGYNIKIGYPVVFKRNSLGWKDKYGSPRFEWRPAFYIFFFNWQFCIFWNSPDGFDDNDLYWEMILWWREYSDKDLLRAEKTWGWQDSKTKTSTWNRNYIKK